MRTLFVPVRHIPKSVCVDAHSMTTTVITSLSLYCIFPHTGPRTRTRYPFYVSMFIRQRQHAR